jgi:hypothetical protein
MGLLEKLKSKNDKIRACMLGKRGLEGLITFPPTFMEDVAPIWEPLSRNIDDMLLLVSKYSQTGLRRSYTELLGYGVIFVVLANTDTALIAFIKGDKCPEDLCQIMGDMDATKDEVLGII